MLKWTKQPRQPLATITTTPAQHRSQHPETDKIQNNNSNNNCNFKLHPKHRYSSGNRNPAKFKYDTLTESSTAAAADTTRKRMSTMTHVLERRRLHRLSLDNQLDARTPRRVRHSLTSVANKENVGVHFTRSSFGNTSLTAFQDLSNGKSPLRPEFPQTRTPTRTALRCQNFGSIIVKQDQETSTRGRFSDDFVNAANETPLSRMRFRNPLREDSLSSSRMGDVTLDRMLDAIIESARKETKSAAVVGNKLLEPAAPLNDSAYLHVTSSDLEQSIHEMEVRTPTHLKRQRVVRRKNPKTAEVRSRNVSQNKQILAPMQAQAQAVRTTMPMIGLTLPDGIPSPGTPLYQSDATKEAELCAMQTPPSMTFVVENQAAVGAATECDLQRCSTPTLEEAQSIKRCLSFSLASDEDDCDFSSAAKRSSVASSNASSTTGEYFHWGRTSRSSQNSLKLGNSGRGSVELAIHLEQRQLNVHVIRCRDLQRSNGSTALNAYVKVALIGKPDPLADAENSTVFQRTAVHRHSSRPFFDQRFRFDVGADGGKSSGQLLQLAVWHRDRQLKRSEFLGCMSFPLQTLLQQTINGVYRLQSKSCLNNPQPPVLLQAHINSNHFPNNHNPNNEALLQSQPQEQQTQPQPQPQPQPQQQLQPQLQVQSKLQSPLSQSQPLPQLQSRRPLPQPSTVTVPSAMISTINRPKSDEDVMSIDSMAQAAGANSDQPMALSRKAMHQRDADENLFLRFLELDPPSEPPVGGGLSALGAGGRRMSGGNKPVGRTPFTLTKKLSRTADRGFGFSIVWTHPPRVEKIEPGLSADRCGLQPGDYVIFVDKQNIVTMPEADVLNLIRSQGANLTLEIFRKSLVGAGGGSVSLPPALNVTSRTHANSALMNGKATPVNARVTSATSDEQQSVTACTTGSLHRAAVAVATTASATACVRPPTACSGGTTSSIEAAKRRLNLPQVTFSKESIGPITDNRRRLILQLISREQNFIAALHFGMQRFVQPLLERKDLISPNDHRTLFQNIDELLRISEDILEQLCNDDQEPQMNFASRVYLSKTTAICAAYKKYCNGIKRADCVLVNKSRQTGSDFVAFITEPQVPRKRPDLTMFIHRPLQHFREILKLMQLLASNCHVDTEEHKNFSTVIAELQAAYREITVSSGLMEPLGEGRPLLTLQDLESRMVFTKCKPFTLAVQGRQWIFGGDLSRVEGRSVKPYWTLLFSDIIVFAKVSRDRVLFITEEPIPIANIVDSCFHMRKKTTEFRLTIDPNGRLAESPTGYCAPDLTRTPKKNARRKSLLLRAPSLELKAVWQNLLQRQIFLVNAALGSTPLSSPLDSPDVLNTLVPLSDIGIASASIGSIKHSSLDSINAKNSQQQSKRYSNASDQIEMLIDEKCRILNKTGTSKSNALHLANWMKGQLDKQQQQARLAAQCASEHITQEDGQAPYNDSDQDERITFWTRQQLEKRTKELNLAKENGYMKARPNFAGKRLSGVEELSMSEAYSENVSQISKSHSTTSDSQITVRSSPNVLDKLAVCRHCHKNCQQLSSNAQLRSTSPTNHFAHNATGADGDAIAVAAGVGVDVNDEADGALLCNSLKVQHSQSSPNRCCRLNGNASQAGSTTSLSSSTITGEQPSEHSSKVVASSSRRETGDTESDVAQLITDDLSQSEATDDSIGGIPSSSSGIDEVKRRLTDSFSKLRILDERHEAENLEGGHWREKDTESQQQRAQGQVLVNGCCLSGSSGGGGDSDNHSMERKDKLRPKPPPRNVRITLQTAKAETTETEVADQQVKTTVTVTETARIIRTQEQKHQTTTESHIAQHKAVTPTKSPRKKRTPPAPRSPATPTGRAAQFIPCSCQCRPADFENTTLSPDELEQQTCKMLASPKQSPQMPRQQQFNASTDVDKTTKEAITPLLPETCLCGRIRHQTVTTAGVDADSKAKTAHEAPTPKVRRTNLSTTGSPLSTAIGLESNLLPTIAVVPPTPEAILTMTSTNLWDNSGTNVNVMTCTTTQLHLNNVPRQAVIENIPDDSCDESPLDEEPPYRPMNNTLRRYGTMSSLEKLPSDDRVDGELDDLENDDDNGNIMNNGAANERDDADGDVDDDEDEDDEMDDKARADKVDHLHEDRKAYNDDTANTSAAFLGGGSAWARRTSGLASGKMSFFEESRAFIDKYLGRWNQEQTAPLVSVSAATASETDEQMDECTSGATSGEEVWGTPTSGGDNDDMQLLNSENTYSSPTKSSNSLNDDDDTELMMDELLMAPPMTASTIRGLLPRRRLEPLFEEETESDEEKTQQESEDIKKGETTTNGRYLEDSAGSSSEELDYEEREFQKPEDEEPNSMEERLQPDLQTTTMGPRPLQQPGVVAMTATPHMPPAVLKASSCEFLLEQRSVAASLATTSCSSVRPTSPQQPRETQQQQQREQQTEALTMEMAMKATMTSTTTMTMRTTKMHRQPPQSPAHSSISTTINNVNVSTASNSYNSMSGATRSTTSASTTIVRQQAKFVPPPPPPRRLLLTQTNLQTSGAHTPTKVPPSQRSSGVSADAGCSAVATTDATNITSTTGTSAAATPTTRAAPVAAKAKPTALGRPGFAAGASTAAAKRSSSTIIETSLLGPAVRDKRAASTSSTTVSKPTTKLQPRQLQTQQPPQPPQRRATTTAAVTKSAKPAPQILRVKEDLKSATAPAPAGSGLSPRLEMRLALNHDILGDEDLISYDPGPDLTTILGHDLSTFQRLTGRDLLNRSVTNRVQPREAVISSQRNSKMDTPTVNRRPRPNAGTSGTMMMMSPSCLVGPGASARVGGVPQHLQPNRNTWSSSAFAAPNSGDCARSGASSKSSSYSSDVNKLSDLEILARREKTYCTSQLKSGSQVRTTTMTTKMATTTTTSRDSSTSPPATRTKTTTMTDGETEGGSMRVRKIGRDETALMETGKGNRLINFIKRRNSESTNSPNCSQSSLSESNASSTPVHLQRQAMQMSPRKDNDKPSLNRRLWKQITKRRRASSASEVAAS